MADPTFAIPAFSVRAAVVQDATTLTTLRVALFEELGQTLAAAEQRGFDALTASSFTTGLAAGYCHAWIAEADPTVILGSVALLVYPRLPSPHSLSRAEGYLLSVYTVPGWRGRGVATALVRAAIDRARELGLARIRLHATADGQRIYAAAGFQSRVNEMELGL